MLNYWLKTSIFQRPKNHDIRPSSPTRVTGLKVAVNIFHDQSNGKELVPLRVISNVFLRMLNWLYENDIRR